MKADVKREGHGWQWSAAFALAAVLSGGVFASPVPVFQHVLEHWEADPYDIVVHHAGTLTDEQQAALAMLERAERGEGRQANLTVIERDHSRVDRGAAAAELPRIDVRYPVMSGIRRTVWSGELTPEVVERLLDSPARREIASHLLDRHTAVFLLLSSGEDEKDAAALEALEGELERLEDALEVPEITEIWQDVDLGEVHTDIAFKVVRVDRDDPDERLLVDMLLGLERDLAEIEGEPMVFPIYGRGLMMHPLVGPGIEASMIAAAGEFLVDECSTCQVKTSHTGVDLLMAVDWSEKVEQRSRLVTGEP